MFKLRRRTVAATTGSDLPFCSMCGQNIRVDYASGRCALGHRVTTPNAAVPVLEPVEADQVTAILEPAADATIPLQTVAESAYETQPLPVYGDEHHASGYVGEGLYEAFQSADAATGHSATWDDVVTPGDSGLVYDEYVSWDEPTNGVSSLDVDPDALPVATAEDDEEAPAPLITPVSSDLLDELDDAAYARRKAVGTIGATIGVSGAVFAAVAMLPF